MTLDDPELNLNGHYELFTLHMSLRVHHKKYEDRHTISGKNVDERLMFLAI